MNNRLLNETNINNNISKETLNELKEQKQKEMFEIHKKK